MTPTTTPPARPAAAPAARASSPMAGPSGSAPPAWIPLSFIGLSGVGLVLFGVAGALGAEHVDAPTHPGMLSAVHTAMLGFLTTGVLGALHQFGPVVGNHPLRSRRAAAVTLALFVPGIWTLAGGFAHGPTWLVPVGGLVATTAILIAAWNVSGALAQRNKGIALVGLRLSVVYLVTTVTFGIVYAFSRNEGWFPLFPYRVMAHAHLGLLGWLGLTYVAVAEKLWPMFLLAHRPGARSGTMAVTLLGVGVPVLATGLLFASEPVAVPGGLLVAGGLISHLTSLVGTIRARRRKLELLHGFVVASAVALVVAMVLGAVAGLAPVDTVWRTRLVSGEVLALAAWLGLALVGHAHKVVPFIVWTRLRATGRMPQGGKPLLFGDLFRDPAARVTLAMLATGFVLALAGLLGEVPAAFAVGSVLVGISGGIAVWNLGTGPRRALRLRAAADAAAAAAA